MFLDGARRVGGGLGGFGGDGVASAVDRGRDLGARHANVHAAARAFARWSNERWVPRGGGIHERERASKPRVHDEHGVGAGAERERGRTVTVPVPVAVVVGRGV